MLLEEQVTWFLVECMLRVLTLHPWGPAVKFVTVDRRSKDQNNIIWAAGDQTADAAEDGRLLQLFLADDACFRSLEASLRFLVLFEHMWFRCGWFGRHQHLSQAVAVPFTHYSRFKIIISSEKLKRDWTLTTSQYTITHIVYFKTQRTVIENTKVT